MRLRRPGLGLLALVVGLVAPSGAHGHSHLRAPTRPVIGNHSMTYLDTPVGDREQAYALTQRAGMRYLRGDFYLGTVFATDPRQPNWTLVDQARATARRHPKVSTLGVVYGTPWSLMDCPPDTWHGPARCAPRDLRDWAAMVSSLVAHTPEVRFWEILNEADLGTFYAGTAASYADLLRVAYAAVKAANPRAQVLISGPANVDRRWLSAVLALARTPTGRPAFDIANVHLRYRTSKLDRAVRDTRALFAANGFTGALWVTESGYPSDPRLQFERGFRSGPRSQADWETTAARIMTVAGAQAVFFSGRDADGYGAASPFATEGFATWPDLRPKPAYWELARLARGA
jgi:hypothetical protein